MDTEQQETNLIGLSVDQCKSFAKSLLKLASAEANSVELSLGEGSLHLTFVREEAFAYIEQRLATDAHGSEGWEDNANNS